MMARAFCLALMLALAFLPDPAQAQSRITRQRAETAALSLVPGGAIVGGNLERDKGRLLWWFDVSIPGSRNLKAIQIDAYSGAVVSNTLTPDGQ
jgi:uncharacterized membrane protein YkoI